MATLPDLDTSSVGFIAFWNALDQGDVAEIDPTEATSAGRIQSYTLYDNGFEGVYNSRSGREINIRVKNDGWIVAYMDQRTNFGQGVGTPDDIRGEWDLIDNWQDYKNGNSNLTDNVLTSAVNTLRSELSNSGAMAYNAADVGLYNYEYPTAAAVTMFSSQNYEGTYDWGEGYSRTQTVSYTGSTDLHMMAAWGATFAESDGADGNSYAHLDINGLDYCGAGGNHEEYSAIDCVTTASMDQADTSYDHGIDANDKWSDAHAYGFNCGILSIWE